MRLRQASDFCQCASRAFGSLSIRKGRHHMGFLDSIQGTFNRGTAAAGRATRAMRLNQRVNEINRERQKLAAQLGASLYEATKDNPDLRAGREALYDGIASLDAEREKTQEEIAAVEAEAAAAEAASQTYTCTRCGATVSAGDLFCSGCGASVEDIKKEIAERQAAETATVESGRTCPSCGAIVGVDDEFCMSCGAKMGPAEEGSVPKGEIVE